MHDPINAVVGALRRARDAAGSGYLKAASPRELGLLYDAIGHAQEGDEAAVARVSRLVAKLERRAALDGPLTAEDRRELKRERRKFRSLTVGPSKHGSDQPAVQAPAERPTVDGEGWARSEGKPERPKTALDAWLDRPARPGHVAPHAWRSQCSRCGWDVGDHNHWFWRLRP